MAGGSSGSIIPDTWHRVVIVVDGSNGVISRYVDGALTGSSPIAAAELPFGRYTLSSQLDIIGFAFTSEGYANSVSLREGAISHGHAVALGKASADGLPAQLPEVPSYVASWVPAGNVADRGTDIGAILDAGDAVIDQASIQLSLDGDAQNAQISKSGSQFTISVDRSLPFAPGTKHTLVLSYSDDKNGAQSYEHVFDAAIYFEDFESVELGPNQDEGLASDKAWSRQGPEGWEVDDSGVPGVGDPDNDGVTEWAGWSLPTRNGGPQQPVASAVRNTASAQEPCSLRIPTNGMIRLMRILKKTDGMKPTSPARPFRWMGLPRELPFCSLPPASGIRQQLPPKRQD